jgi:hypothetical protein
MSNAAFVLVAIAVIVVVSLLMWVLSRKPQTFMSSIDDFEREMKALGHDAASHGGRRRRRLRAAEGQDSSSTAESSDPTSTPSRGITPTSLGKFARTETESSEPDEAGASGEPRP